MLIEEKNTRGCYGQSVYVHEKAFKALIIWLECWCIYGMSVTVCIWYVMVWRALVCALSISSLDDRAKATHIHKHHTLNDNPFLLKAIRSKASHCLSAARYTQTSAISSTCLCIRANVRHVCTLRCLFCWFSCRFAPLFFASAVLLLFWHSLASLSPVTSHHTRHPIRFYVIIIPWLLFL